MTTRLDPPVCSVVLCAYNSRNRIDWALRSLSTQDLEEPFEVIAVVSGTDGCAEHLKAQWPEVRLVKAGDRLYPGAARNAGILASRGDIIAFLPDDGIASEGWLRARVAKHRLGFPLVAGAVSNATPRSLVGTAGYYVEYAASIPVQRVLEQQPIPHTLSYRREVFSRLGLFPEIDHPGEDTLFNARCVAEGLPVTHEPRAQIGHLNLTSLSAYLRHQFQHGCGLARCITEHGLASPVDGGTGCRGAAHAAILRYPAWRWRRTLRLVRYAGRPHTTRFLVATPVAILGYLAAGLGMLHALHVRPRASLDSERDAERETHQQTQRGLRES